MCLCKRSHHQTEYDRRENYKTKLIDYFKSKCKLIHHTNCTFNIQIITTAECGRRLLFVHSHKNSHHLRGNGFSPLPNIVVGQRVDSLASHVFGKATLRLTGHRLVEGHIEEAEVWPLLGIFHQRGRLPCTCGRQRASSGRII